MQFDMNNLNNYKDRALFCNSYIIFTILIADLLFGLLAKWNISSKNEFIKINCDFLFTIKCPQVSS